MEAEKKRAAWRLSPGTTGGCLIDANRTDDQGPNTHKNLKKDKKEVERRYGPVQSVVGDYWHLQAHKCVEGVQKRKRLVGDEDGRRACG
jgi:hypothetical protein